MQIKNIALTAAIVAALAFAGCAKKEEAPAVEAPAAEAAAPAPAPEATALLLTLLLLQHLLLMLLQHLLLMPLLLLQHQKLHLSNLYLAKKESLCSPFFIAFLGSQKNKSFHKEALILNMPTQSLSLYAFFLSFE